MQMGIKTEAAVSQQSKQVKQQKLKYNNAARTIVAMKTQFHALMRIKEIVLEYFPGFKEVKFEGLDTKTGTKTKCKPWR